MIASRSTDPCPVCGSASVLDWEENVTETWGFRKFRYRIYCGKWRVTGCERETAWEPSYERACAAWQMKCALLK